MKRGLTDAEMAARIAARDAERDKADERRAWIAMDRREEFAALSELTLNRKTS